jgi:lariat debranching enzyme
MIRERFEAYIMSVNIVSASYLSSVPCHPCHPTSSHMNAPMKLPSNRVFLSHDWPQSIEQHGDVHGLLSRKKFFRKDVETGQLGSPPLMGLLQTLRPEWWFAAHLHTRFEAAVVNPDEITLDEEEVVVEAPLAPLPAAIPSETRFLALDKCLPKRDFLEVRLRTFGQM